MNFELCLDILEVNEQTIEYKVYLLSVNLARA